MELWDDLAGVMGDQEWKQTVDLRVASGSNFDVREVFYSGSVRGKGSKR